MKIASCSLTSLALAVAIGSASIVAPAPAVAQWAVFDPTNYIQNFMTQLRAVQSNANELLQIQNQLQQYQVMLQNTRNLQANDLNGFVDAMGRLDRIMGEGRSLSIAAGDYERRFREMFPGYESSANYGERYRAWNDTSRDSILGAMRVANMQVQGIGNESQAINSLIRAARSTDGQKAALDAANEIAVAQVTQMQQLRELMVAQIQAEGTYMAAQTQAEATRKRAESETLKYRDPRQGWKPNPIRVGN